MASTAPMIAAAAAAARRRFRHAFERATTPDTAIPYVPARHLDRRYFDRLLACGAVVEASPGLYYLDEPRLAAYNARRRKRVFVLLGGVLAVAAAALGLSQL
ncbi:MAG TPA: hypothetical protein VGD66_11375 [Allosphingosinicella sp.]|jgi:hypothetical protein